MIIVVGTNTTEENRSDTLKCFVTAQISIVLGSALLMKSLHG